MELKRSAVSDLINYRTSIYHRVALILSLTILWISGVLWLCIEYLELKDLNFLRALMMKLHGGAAIIFIMVFGALWLHFMVGFVTKLRLKSGFTLLASSLLLIISGWILYYQPDGIIRSIAFWTHVVVGVFMPVLFALHIGNKIRILLNKQID